MDDAAARLLSAKSIMPIFLLLPPVSLLPCFLSPGRPSHRRPTLCLEHQGSRLLIAANMSTATNKLPTTMKEMVLDDSEVVADDVVLATGDNDVIVMLIILRLSSIGGMM